MRTIRLGDRGTDVLQWQNFLIGQGFEIGSADGDFGRGTLLATQQFQEKYGLSPDGLVGNRTIGQAQVLGLDVIPDNALDRDSANWPPRPAGLTPLMNNQERAAVFGRFSYVHDPKPDNRENIRITDKWERDNIVSVAIPQLKKVRGSNSKQTVRCHKRVVAQLQALWSAWEQAGLLGAVRSWDGMFVARFIRGSTTVLSNHAFGSAFDINAEWNPLGTRPALMGRPGCVRELVQIANEHGFFWGGHYGSRPDGMHFEVAKLMG